MTRMLHFECTNTCHSPPPLSPATPQPELRAGALCLAQFSLDKQWYRAYVEKAHIGAYDVFFIDFGNRWVGVGGGGSEAGCWYPTF